MNAAKSSAQSTAQKLIDVGKRDLQKIEGLVKEYCSHFGADPQEIMNQQIQKDSASVKETLRETLLALSSFSFLFIIFCQKTIKQTLSILALCSKKTAPAQKRNAKDTANAKNALHITQRRVNCHTAKDLNARSLVLPKNKR